MRVAFLSALLGLLICFELRAEPASPEPGSPVPASHALSTLFARPGFQVELVAAEPLVMDPVAFAWGPDGRLWVAEMADYPLGLDGQGKFGGRIRYLEDTDGDGRYDRSTVFLEGIGFPSGVMPWHRGVLVTAAPDIFYAEDADGDGKAEIRRTLYTGFVEGNQQHRVNGLRWGLDNWVHCANGDSGGSVISEKTDKKLSINGRDLRIRPDEGLIETQTGVTQFGRDTDDWGNWFGSKNGHPVTQYVLAEEYLRRNPHLAALRTVTEVPSIPGAAPIYPRSRTVARFNDLNKANRFTSACGMCIYRDELLGPEFVGNSFVCEPVHNLVHREVLRPSGVTFTSRRADDEQHSEFLASTDNWSRPVMVRTGPDGALWVADMYRQTIEHPQWIPKDWQKRLDLRAGHDKGRIYRVFPTGKRPRPIGRLDHLSTAELVAMLEHPSGTWRDVVQQQLVHQHDPAAIVPLKKLVAEGKRPQARLHALCTLDGLQALDEPTLLAALADRDSGVRRHAIRLSEPLLNTSQSIAKMLPRLAGDADAFVRLQLVYSLGTWQDADAGKLLAQLARWADDFTATAILSSVNERNLFPLTTAVLADSSLPRRGEWMEKLAGQAVAVDNQAALRAIVVFIVGPATHRQAFHPSRDRLEALRALADALERRKSSLAAWRKAAKDPLRADIDLLAPVFSAAAQTALSEHASASDRTLAIGLLGRGLDSRAEDIAKLAGLLAPRSPQSVQAAAIAALVNTGEPGVPEILLSDWKGFSPSLRGQVLDALLARAVWTGKLLDALQQGRLAANEIDAARAQRLLGQKDKALASRSARLLAGSVQVDRQKALAAYEPVVHMSGDARRGAAVFEKRCSTCHKIGKVGHGVGPDLTALTDKSPKSLLVAVLDPNRAVEAKFVNYTAITDSGLTYQGMLIGESANSVTLLQPEGKQVALLRSQLEALSSTSKSLMPEGLEKDLKPQDLADVFALLEQSGPQRKAFAGNRPEVVEPEALRGELYLLPEAAELYGDTVIWESRYGNFGHWESENDHAIWTLDVKQGGPYNVQLEYACNDAAAGNSVLIVAQGKRLTWPVASTGSWDSYRSVQIGRIDLPAGKVRLVLRPAEKPRGAVFDLKTVRLQPVPH
jgi:putative membrane-bound dehydrogenase-like protein